MCVIINMQPNTLIDKEAWDNAVNNNEHGFGMVVFKPRKNKNDELLLIKKFDEKGLNPDDLWKIVTKYKRYNRWIHLRYKTVGSVTEDNVQPFLILDDDAEDKTAFFMHNGTLSQFKSHPVTYIQGVRQPDKDDEKSDSQRFADEVLVSSLPHIYGETGVGDYHNDFFTKYIVDLWQKQGSVNNRGLIISNYAKPLIINKEKWTTLYNSEKSENGDYYEFMVSNDDYFDTLKRGSLFDKIEEEKKRNEEKERQKRITNQSFDSVKNNSNNRLTKLSNVTPNNPIYVNPPKLVNIFGDPDIFDGVDLNGHFLSTITYDEWIELLKSQEFSVGAYILSRLSEELHDVTEKNTKLRDNYTNLTNREIKLGNDLSEVKAKLEKASAQNRALLDKLKKAGVKEEEVAVG